MINYIRKKIAQKEVDSLAINHCKKAEFRNLAEINNILLLSKVENIDQVKTLKRAAEKFTQENKKVTLVVFYPAKELTDEMLVENGVYFLSLKDTNWKRLPELSQLPYMDSSKFDLAVDFSKESSLQIAWLAYMSNACFTASRNLEESFADFTIKIPSHKDETFLAEQIIFYLRTIKSK